MPKASSDIALPVVDKRTIRPSKSGRRRAIVLGVVQVLMIVHFIQWWITGHTVSPIEPSESMEAVKNGVINAGAVFFVLALLSTLVLGRWFCGWGCHVVMLQDGCGWFMRKIGIKPKPFRSRVLVYVPFILALYMFVWPAVYRWGVAPLSAKLHQMNAAIPALQEPTPWQGFSLELTTGDFWQTFPGVLVAIPFLLICGFATVYFLGNKGFCTYGCPYGGFFAPVEQYAPGRIRVNDDCEQCGHCTAVCTSNVRVHEEVAAYGMVVDPGCMKCLDCVSVCPNDALSFGFGKPAAGRTPARGPEPKRKYDLTVGEEVAMAVVFLLSFLAVRGVYGVVPMLMAAGVAGIVTFLAWKLWRLVRDQNGALHRFRLKYHGRVRPAGIVFAVLAAGVLLLTVHSGAVTLLTHLAGRADRRVTVPRIAIFSSSPMMLRPEMDDAAQEALRYYELAGPIGEGGIGLLAHPENLLRRAWLRACRHEFEESERLLRRQQDRFGPNEFISRDIAILMRLRNELERAAAHYEETLAAHPDWVRMRDDQVVWLESIGRPGDAITAARAALDQQDDDESRLFLMRRLSLLLVNNGRLDEGIELFERTIEMDDTNPAAYSLLAGCYYQRGDVDESIEALARAIELRPDFPDFHEQMAQMLEGQGRVIEAASYADRARSLRGG